MLAFARRAWTPVWSQPYLLLALTTLMWAGNAVASRLAVGEIGPMTLTSLRWVVVIAILAPLLYGDLVRHLPALRPRWRLIVLMGCLGFTAFNALMYAAAHTTSAINLGIVQGSIPMIVLLGAFLAYRTPVSTVQIAGALVTIVGVLTVAAQGDLAVLTGFAFNPGDLMMIVACLFYAGYTVGLRDRPPVPGLVFFAAMAFVACLTSLPLLAWENASPPTGWPSPKGWLILLYVSLGPSLLSQLFFMRGVELIGPGRAGIFVNLVPVFAPVLAVAILGEPFRWYHAVALALVLGGIWLAERGRAR
jgi:drug/metabolite transporter (DMT)-like permease